MRSTQAPAAMRWCLPGTSSTYRIPKAAKPPELVEGPEGRRHPEGVVPGNPLSPEVAQFQGPLHQLQGQLRRAPVLPSTLRHTRRRAPALVRSPTLRQIQPLVHQRAAQRADVGQKHPGLAVGHLALPAAVLPGHPCGLPALLRKVAAVQHPHGLGMLQPGSQIFL